MKRLLAVALVVAAALWSLPATGTSDELPKSKDNGAHGTDSQFNAGDVPVWKACNNVRSKAGSIVERKLPTGPMRKNGSLAFTSGVCVYLPPGYATSGLRYPVVYLLHGGGGDQGEWVTFGHVQAIADAAYAKDHRNAVIIAIPDAGSDAGWFNAFDQRYMNESYVLNHVIPYMDTHFRTIADRRGRVIDGLSNGGYGALHLAAKRPDLFAAAGSMSGNLGFRGDDSGQDPVDSPSYKEGNLPAPLASNLDGLDIVMDIGALCTNDALIDGCAGFAFDQLFRADNRYFVDQMDAVKHKGVLDFRPTEGGHAWRWWSKWFATRHLPFLLKRAADPMAMTTPVVPSKPRYPFRYRSVFKYFGAYGYSVTVTRSVREFMDLENVTTKGFTVRGSGSMVLKTPRIYTPGRMYYARGAVRPNLIATTDGRLEIAVDLGPSHTAEDASPQGRAGQQTDGYWTTKRIDIFAM